MTTGTPTGYDRRGQQSRAANPLDGITGSFAKAEDISAALQRAQQTCNLVGPIAVGSMPEGHEVIITSLLLNPDPKAGDVYKVGDKYAPSKPAIDRIANAAGVSTVESTCMQYAPQLCQYKVVRQMRGLDGTLRRAEGQRLIDLRPNSEYFKSLTAAQAKEVGKMLPAHTETKARLRADRALLGIRTYTADELRRPFIIASIQFTGRSNDPAIRQMFAMMIAQNALSGSTAMFGPPPQPAYALPMGGGAPPPMLPQHHAPAGAPTYGPPAGGFASPGDDFDDQGGGGGDDAPPENGPAVNWAAVKSAGDFAIAFGKDKGKKISEVRDLSWMRGILEGDIDNPEKANFRDASLRKLKAIYELLRSRGEVTPLDAAAPPPPSAPGSGRGAPPPVDDYADPDADGR